MNSLAQDRPAWPVILWYITTESQHKLPNKVVKMSHWGKLNNSKSTNDFKNWTSFCCSCDMTNMIFSSAYLHFEQFLGHVYAICDDRQFKYISDTYTPCYSIHEYGIKRLSAQNKWELSKPKSMWTHIISPQKTLRFCLYLYFSHFYLRDIHSGNTTTECCTSGKI